ncbi:hypothetical protein AAV94_12285 [Lampropedia cohaerens]|uniref:Calcium-binding protein n=1 Tax=Lampropedia cohaerens TaxID=1610491 RepID=A0A0U1PX33_9BURK|nr:DUF937 domain-containing protein [Lampropedia cohaerens]KKW67102.1 hypothetical protein AAV94_12285 [Lampropedia cohaerens]
MPQSIADDILAQLRGGSLGQIAQQLGASEQQTETAVSTALPFLLGALGDSAQQGGVQQLFGAVQRDHVPQQGESSGGFDVAGMLGSLLGGTGGSGTGALGALLGSAGGGAFDGEGILSHILGGKTTQAEHGLSQATGLETNRVHQLLLMLAPIVMAYLGRKVSSGEVASPEDLGAVLGQEREHVRQQGGAAGGLLGALLDQNGDGKLDVGDLFKLGGQLFGGKR